MMYKCVNKPSKPKKKMFKEKNPREVYFALYNYWMK